MTQQHACTIGSVTIGAGNLALIAGPCVAESLELCLDVAGTLADSCRRLGIGYIFKTSYDKANRTSLDSYRGPGLATGLDWLRRVRQETGAPVLTDVHEVAQAAAVAQAVDCIQIPAFLCRQTDLLVAAGKTLLPVNIKKGQFMAPQDMAHVVAKVRSTGNAQVLLTERGTSFGHNMLVTDFRGIVQMQAFAPVVFDATHSVQEPGGLGHASSGKRQYVPVLAQAALAAGADALFIETHTDPDNAKSDAASQMALKDMPRVLETCLKVFEVVKPE